MVENVLWFAYSNISLKSLERHDFVHCNKDSQWSGSAHICCSKAFIDLNHINFNSYKSSFVFVFNSLRTQSSNAKFANSKENFGKYLNRIGYYK